MINKISALKIFALICVISICSIIQAAGSQSKFEPAFGSIVIIPERPENYTSTIEVTLIPAEIIITPTPKDFTVSRDLPDCIAPNLEFEADLEYSFYGYVGAVITECTPKWIKILRSDPAYDKVMCRSARICTLSKYTEYCYPIEFCYYSWLLYFKEGLGSGKIRYWAVYEAELLPELKGEIYQIQIQELIPPEARANISTVISPWRPTCLFGHFKSIDKDGRVEYHSIKGDQCTQICECLAACAGLSCPVCDSDLLKAISKWRVGQISDECLLKVILEWSRSPIC